MTLNTESAPGPVCLLLERIIRSITLHHEDLIVKVQEHAGGTLFDLRCHGAEGPRINGKKGQHIRSIQAIISLIGKGRGTVYVVRLQEPTFGNWEQRDVPRREGPYRPEKATLLLEDVLYAVFGRVCPKVLVNNPPGLTLFRLIDVSPKNLELLNAKHQIYGVSLLEALQTIWKAYGREEGWTFQVTT